MSQTPPETSPSPGQKTLIAFLAVFAAALIVTAVVVIKNPQPIPEPAAQEVAPAPLEDGMELLGPQGQAYRLVADATRENGWRLETVGATPLLPSSPLPPPMDAAFVGTLDFTVPPETPETVHEESAPQVEDRWTPSDEWQAASRQVRALSGVRSLAWGEHRDLFVVARGVDAEELGERACSTLRESGVHGARIRTQSSTEAGDRIVSFNMDCG